MKYYYCDCYEDGIKFIDVKEYKKIKDIGLKEKFLPIDIDDDLIKEYYQKQDEYYDVEKRIRSLILIAETME